MLAVEHFGGWTRWERLLFLTLRAFGRSKLTARPGKFSSEDFFSAKVSYFAFPATPLQAAPANGPGAVCKAGRSSCPPQREASIQDSQDPQLQSQPRAGTLSQEGKMELKPTWDGPTSIQPGGHIEGGGAVPSLQRSLTRWTRDIRILQELHLKVSHKAAELCLLLMSHTLPCPFCPHHKAKAQVAWVAALCISSLPAMTKRSGDGMLITHGWCQDMALKGILPAIQDRA